jgi:hypothetical protein
MTSPGPLPVARAGGGADGDDQQQQRQHRRWRRRRAVVGVGVAAAALALLAVVATAAGPPPSSLGRPAAAAAAALATGGKRLLQHLAPAEPAQEAAAFSVSAGGAADDPAAAAAQVEYLFDPAEHSTSSSTADDANSTAASRRSWRARPWHSRMRELFPDVLADGHEALELSPSKHGWSNKTGVADLAAWALREDGRRLDDFFGWRTDRCAAARDPQAEAESVRSGSAFTCAAARHPPTPFPGCHVFVNHAYRFIYIRSPKSASTSIVDVLGECGNTRTAAHLAPSCMKHSWEGALSVEEIERVWKDYFVFGFVRNPWKRAYSLYKYLHSDGCMQ